MLDLQQTIFLGIDPTTTRPPCTFTALDADLRVIATGSGKVIEVLSYAAGLGHALAALNAPSSPNTGLAERDEAGRHLFADPQGGRWSNLRMAEAELLKRGLPSFQTPGKVQDCTHWMQRGFKLYQRLEAAGYSRFPDENSPRQWMEVQAETAFSALTGHPLFEAHTLEGRLQRQLILHDQKLPVEDPMDFFEEVTRHKLLRGKLAYNLVLNQHELNALAAAFTGWLAVHKPEALQRAGDPAEGVTFFPACAYQI